MTNRQQSEIDMDVYKTEPNSTIYNHVDGTVLGNKLNAYWNGVFGDIGGLTVRLSSTKRVFDTVSIKLNAPYNTIEREGHNGLDSCIETAEALITSFLEATVKACGGTIDWGTRPARNPLPSLKIGYGKPPDFVLPPTTEQLHVIKEHEVSHDTIPVLSVSEPKPVPETVETNATESTSFAKELEVLINKHSVENDSGTPDFMLAEYLIGCLDQLARVVGGRDAWYGFKSYQKRRFPSAPVDPEVTFVRANNGKINQTDEVHEPSTDTAHTEKE